MKKIAIVEDDLVMAKLLEKKINSLDGFDCSGVYINPKLFLSIDPSSIPDIVILDVSLPEISGLEAIPLILEKFPKVHIVMNTIHDDAETIFNALKLGAVGYIDKHEMGIGIEEILHTVSLGGGYMTPAIARKVITHFQTPSTHFKTLTKREKEIAEAILDGLSYKLIGDKFHISLDTVRMHIKNVYKKLNINSKGELFKIMKSPI
jgi:DNA-binding NarL/FixJ family response regulator